MDDHSQSSDVFSVSDDHELSIYSTNKVDLDAYSSLVSSVKLWLSQSPENEIHKTNFPHKFTSVMEDCEVCISQSCNLINSIISEQDVQIEKLYEFMDNAMKLLQLVNCYINNVAQTVSMACCSYGNLPTTTGNIIGTVFTHCKNSETLYGIHLKHFETQLKDLFRACHELQITYLMVLDKQYSFDLDRQEEIDILLESLNINLQIGEIVQTLDVKTMAEQWKGYMLICEKYATSLAQSEVFNNTTKLLVTITEHNVNTALETANNDVKLTVRSLKVASFTIKILIKVCHIFKQATMKDFEHILELLLYVYLNNSPYIQKHKNKSQQFIHMMKSNILPPCDALLKELLGDELFVKTVFTFDMEAKKHEDKTLGYILLIMNMMKLTCQQNDNKVSSADLINTVYKYLPYGHIWFNMGLKFEVPSEKAQPQTYGLYEHLLSHTYALATRLSCDERTILLDHMIEAILGLDTYSALFSANLWCLIARSSSLSSTVLTQISCACAYDYTVFETSPQHIHIRKFMGKLNEVRSEKNMNFFIHLLVKDMKDILESTPNEKQIQIMCKNTRWAMTATAAISIEFDSFIAELLERIVNAWMKSCPNNNSVMLQCFGRDLDITTGVFVDYLRSLAALTKYIGIKSLDEVAQVKILHTVSSLMQHGNTEIKLAVMNLLLEFVQKRVVGENADISNAILSLTFRSLFQENDALVREKFYNHLRKHKVDTNVLEIVSNAIENDRSLQKIWDTLSYAENDSNCWKVQLTKTFASKFVHKCLENSSSQVDLCDSDSVKLIDKTNSNNFDFADIDSLFDCDSDSEPASKKVKLNPIEVCNKVILNPNEVSEIVARLERESEHLCQSKENVFTHEHKCKIREVCAKLQRLL